MKVPTFNGEESNYQRWWIRFKAYANLVGFSKALEITPESDLLGSENDLNNFAGGNDNTKKQKDAAKGTIDPCTASLWKSQQINF